MRYSTAVPIGQGGTSEVLKAWDETLGRFVALKLLRRADPGLAQRLLREARAQARLEHPNVCRIYEVGDQDGVPYIAMQYIDGEEIGALAPHLSVTEKVRAIATVAEAVHAAHRSGLVHRDLKPGNIMMERQGEQGWKPYVLDFGLVGDASAPALTITGELLGTPAFMAPEQASGSRVFDRRTDVYGLGATLYDLLTGVPPFGKSSMPELFHDIIKTEPTPLRQRDPSIPRDLETIVLKCLAKTPARRYATALALADDLQRVLDGEPIAARPPSWSFRVGRRLRRHRAVVGIALAAVATSVGAAGYGVHERWTSTQRAAAAQRFGAEVRDLEWLMRTGHLLPAHDIRDQRREVERRLTTLEEDMAALGKPARGPGHYAIGRGLLAVGDVDRALPRLQQAWDLGFRAPEAAYARGLALGEMYRRETARIRSIRDPEARQAASDDAIAQWRDPALDAFDRGRATASAPADYVEALIAFHEQRWDDTLTYAQAALESTPWLYEALTLSGDVYLLRATERIRTEEQAAADEATSQARAAFEAAVALAPSWPAAYNGLCTMAATGMNRALNNSRSKDVAGLAAAGLEACERATTIDPDAWRGWMTTSDILRFWGLSEHRSGVDPLPRLERAVTLAERAVHLAPDETRPLLTLADGYLEWGITSRDGDHAASRLRQSVATFDQVLDRDPRSAAALNNRGIALRHLARRERQAGLDPSATLAATADSYRRLKEVMPELRSLDANIALVLEDRARYGLESGADARAAIDEAVAGARVAIISRPDHPSTHDLLARVLSLDAADRITRGQGAEAVIVKTVVTEAVTIATRAVELSPEEGYSNGAAAVAMNRIAEALVDTGVDPGDLLDQARQWARRYAELVPGRDGSPGSLAEVAWIEAKRRVGRGGDPRPLLNRAIADLDRVLEREPDHVGAHHRIGRARRLEAEYRASIGRDPHQALDQAEAAFEHALSARPSHGPAALDRVRCNLIRAAWWLPSDSFNDSTHAVDARVHSALTEAEAGLADLGERLAEHPDRMASHAELAWLLARVAVASGAPPESVINDGRAWAQRTLERAPHHALALTVLARLDALVTDQDVDLDRVNAANPYAAWRLNAAR